ncbi:MAG: phosphate acyltransferase PlsX [Bacteroidota bacterium]|jgi:glycerol-3-phosphate acyltransferase PlsX
MRIGLDIMGGDFAPQQSCLGIQEFLESDYGSNSDSVVYALGDAQVIKDALAHLPQDRIVIVHAPELVAMNDHPTKVFKEKPNSAIAIGFGMLAAGKLDAFISAGNTGSMLVGAAMVVKPISGVQRPTIPTYVPRTDGSYGILLDVGINADCKPENLEEFAQLASIYSKSVFGVEKPKVGLLNIGEEEGKGNLLAKAAFPLLKANPFLNFIGNVEGRDIFTNKVDVIVCDGFTGNIVLKMAESIHHIFAHERGIKDEYLNNFNYEMYGGTPVLGVNKTVIVGHGVSSARAFAQMLQQADGIARSGMLEAMKAQFEATND